MAYTHSGDLVVGQTYRLGEYAFTINTTVSEGVRVVQAHVDGPEGTAAKGIDLPTSSQIMGWYVEANSDTADVYAKVKRAGIQIPNNMTEGWFATISCAGPTGHYRYFTKESDPPAFAGVYYNTKTDWCGFFVVSDKSNLRVRVEDLLYPKDSHYWASGESATYRGATFYYLWGWGFQTRRWINVEYDGLAYIETDKEFPEALYPYLDTSETEEAILIARFAIDLEEAGGGYNPYDPGSGWEEPIDSGDAEKVLLLTVTGALSGRHNDPLHDPSYSYVPADNMTEKGYGCGGDGGYGGGGGAGSSTVIIRKFATEKAGSQEVTARTQRHGYGSGGGKGGRGGDGCIIIFY